MSYKLDFSDAALSRLEALGKTDAKKLRQVLMKILSLRREPFPQDSKKLENFNYQGLIGHRVDQGEYRIIYAVDDAARTVILARIARRDTVYR